MTRLHPMLAPFTPTDDDPWDRVKAAHLLNRAGFGGTVDEVEKVYKLGPVDAVNWLMDFPNGASDEIAPDDGPDLSGIEGYPRSFADRQRIFRNKTPEERQILQQQMNQANGEALRAISLWWIKRMASCAYPLHEKLTFFWHGHFTTSARDERSAWLMWQQNETLRAHAAGNFGQFVHAISHDPAMLDYLNNQQNRKAHPNENYARELMELFTLGIGNYTEDDVKQVARAFTGWAHDGESFVFRKFDHDTGVKSFLGRTGNFDGDDAINIILQQRSCAPYICGKLWAYFVNENVDALVVQSLGQLFRDENYEIRPVLRTMFASRAFYAPQNIGAIIKCPVQLVVGTTRQLQVQQQGRGNFGFLQGALQQMGQVPLQPPNVKGWPGGRLWINTSTLFVRQNTALALANMTDRRRNATRFNDPSMTTDQIVDHWLATLIQRPVDPERRRVLVDAVGPKPNENSVRNAINLILSMPEYQLC
ncbi:MAG: DUF1800 domain-containing protein [Tepidisphaeraceae bacterium]